MDHYLQSGENYQAAVARATRDLCLPSEPRTQWTEIHGKYKGHKSIPKGRSPLLMASALGLDKAVRIFLHEQGSTGIDLERDIDAKDTELGWTPLS
jgi:hypothetical protein